MHWACHAILLVLAGPTFATPPQLEVPLDCTLGQTCYIEDYVDVDTGPGQSDYNCGVKSRNDHRGTDFALPSYDAMQRGVDVLAAANGKVAAIRDGMPDVEITDETRPGIEGRECGNAVRIDHGDGWQTLYCHMASGSIRVRVGESVASGDVLGRVGLSGLTNYPHLHFGVLKDQEIIDPFNPRLATSCTPEPVETMWRQTPVYEKAGLFTAAFSTSVPNFDDVQSGAARIETGRTDQPIVLYAHAFYARPGDTLQLSATGPRGEIFNEHVVIDTEQAQIFRAFGRRGPDSGWPPGRYEGRVELRRDGQLLAARQTRYDVIR